MVGVVVTCSHLVDQQSPYLFKPLWATKSNPNRYVMFALSGVCPTPYPDMTCPKASEGPPHAFGWLSMLFPCLWSASSVLQFLLSL